MVFCLSISFRYDLVEWGSIPLTPAEGGAVSQKTLEHNALFKKARHRTPCLLFNLGNERDFIIEKQLPH